VNDGHLTPSPGRAWPSRHGPASVCRPRGRSRGLDQVLAEAALTIARMSARTASGNMVSLSEDRGNEDITLDTLS